jgi:hypothetical protein
MGIFLKDKRINFALAITCVSILLIGLISFWPGQRSEIGLVEKNQVYVQDRLASFLNLDNLQPNKNFRSFLILVVGPKLFAASPILGMGAGTFGSPLATNMNASFYRDLGIGHELLKFVMDVEYVTILGQFGILGIIALISLFVGIITLSSEYFNKASDPLIKGVCLGVIGTIIIIAVFNFSGQFMEVRFTSIYLWLFAGLVVAIKNSQEDKVLEPCVK